jgi:CDP-glycerol glycerophosphotransferase
MDIGKRMSTTKLVLLVPRSGTRPPILLPARSVRRPDVTDGSGQRRYNYEWSGFRCEISPRWFGVGGHWLTGEWDCFVLVRGRAVWRPARLYTSDPPAEQPEYAQIAPGVSFGAYWVGRRLRVRLARGGLATPETRAGSASSGADTALAQAPEPVRIEQGWSSEGKLVLRGALPVARPIVLRHLDGWTRYTVTIDAQADGTGADHAPGHRSDVSVEVPVGAMDIFGDLVPLRDGRWVVGLGHTDDGGPDAVEPVAAARTDGRPTRIGKKVFRCTDGPDGNGLVLSVGPALHPLERRRIRRRLLRDVYYRLQRLLPLREAILFVSFHGHSCIDNPLAIAEELRRRGDRRDQIWVVRDWSVPVPAGATAVLSGTASYFAALGRSRYLISNDHLAQPNRSRSGQRYVQSWHGTPLKRLGYDIVNPTFASGSRFFNYMAHDVAQWDLLISPNPFSTPIFRQAFKYDGEISETGYPRNDALLAQASEPSADVDAKQAAKAAGTRRRLGLPDGKRVAMYVPTWRDNQHDGTSRYRFDLQLDLAAARQRLAGDYVLLIRGHHLMVGWELTAAEPGFAFDVTAYPDINDLLGLTDVLITDYSSVMFDFAPTGRPQLFFTYDLEQYRDQLRGFYFDFEAAAPGPLLATSDQVIEALADIDGVAAKYHRAHSEFVASFCPLDDGKASARACDRIFKG